MSQPLKLNRDGNNRFAIYSRKSPFCGNVFEEYGEYSMKIGKYKGKTLNELRKTEAGKKYLYWFMDNVVNESNEKYYGKLIRVVNMMRDMDESTDDES
jgi:hypothetical protein